MPSDFKAPPRVKDPDLLKRFRLEQYGTACWFCDMRPGIHVHHREYGIDKTDALENLVWLCGACHDEAHGVRGIWNL